MFRAFFLFFKTVYQAVILTGNRLLYRDHIILYVCQCVSTTAFALNVAIFSVFWELGALFGYYRLLCKARDQLSPNQLKFRNVHGSSNSRYLIY